VARIKPRLLRLAPLILAYFGIRALPAPAWHVPADLGLLALSAAVSVGLGIWRGQTIKVWRDADGTWWRQGSARTLALWGALIVARGLLYGLDAALGHREASGLGAILLTLALSFAAQDAVTALRMYAVPPLTGGELAEPAAGRAMAVSSGALLTIASTPAGSKVGTSAAKRAAGDETDAAAQPRLGRIPRRLGAGGEDAPWSVRINDLLR
jgi:hypothetical protein